MDATPDSSPFCFPQFPLAPAPFLAPLSCLVYSPASPTSLFSLSPALGPSMQLCSLSAEESFKMSGIPGPSILPFLVSNPGNSLQVSEHCHLSCIQGTRFSLPGMLFLPLVILEPLDSSEDSVQMSCPQRILLQAPAPANESLYVPQLLLRLVTIPRTGFPAQPLLPEAQIENFTLVTDIQCF